MRPSGNSTIDTAKSAIPGAHDGCSTTASGPSGAPRWWSTYTYVDQAVAAESNAKNAAEASSTQPIALRGW